MKKYFIAIFTILLFSCSDSTDDSINIVSNLKIGDYYQGGYIAHIYIKNEPGYVEGETHGIIAAPIDIGKFLWSGQYEIVGTSELMGSGVSNNLMITDSFSYGNVNKRTAAEAFINYQLNGYSDWVLPSKGDLNKFYFNLNLKGLADFSGVIYWSSSEENEREAYGRDFSANAIYRGFDKKILLTVRGVRYF